MAFGIYSYNLLLVESLFKSSTCDVARVGPGKHPAHIYIRALPQSGMTEKFCAVPRMTEKEYGEVPFVQVRAVSVMWGSTTPVCRSMNDGPPGPGTPFLISVG